jgi:hypothetical protein
MTPTIVLATIPGRSDNERLLVLFSVADAALTLCSQTWADGVGWFTQGSVRIDSEQLGQLRAALGRGSSRIGTLPDTHFASRDRTDRRSGDCVPAILTFPPQHARAESA